MTTAIVGAMTCELGPFMEGLEEQHPRRRFRKQLARLYSGEHHGHPLVVVKTGPGKVNAALGTQLLLDFFPVDAVVQVGIAGACAEDLNQGDLIIGNRYIQHDFDLTCLSLGLTAGEVIFDLSTRSGKMIVDEHQRIREFFSDSSLVRLAEKAVDFVFTSRSSTHGTKPRRRTGTIVSGDQFVASEPTRNRLWSEFDALATEMEGASVAQVCYLNDTKFVGIRAISDGADGSAPDDITDFLPRAARSYHEVVLHMICQLRQSGGGRMIAL